MQTFNIGRNETNDIVLNDKMVSRQHAQLIVLDNGQILIKDLGSSNGTFVNGNRTTECRLTAGDVVKCGTAFVEWNRYINNRLAESLSIQNRENAIIPENLNFNNSDLEIDTHQSYSLKKTIEYLTTKIFNVGDLFKYDWDKGPSILFFLLTPFVIVFFACLYIYTKTQNNFFIQNNFLYQVILPVILAAFIYGVSQFLTLSLLSLKGVSKLEKNLFASSIVSFLQFTIAFFIILSFASLALAQNGTLLHGAISWQSYHIFLILAVLTIIISLTFTLIIFIYKFFRAIGITSGISLHLTILSVFIILALQFTFGYFFISLTTNSLLNL
jgi:hypothetical protein